MSVEQKLVALEGHEAYSDYSAALKGITPAEIRLASLLFSLERYGKPTDIIPLEDLPPLHVVLACAIARSDEAADEVVNAINAANPL